MTNVPNWSTILFNVKIARPGIVVLVKRYQHRLWNSLVDIGNLTGSVVLVRLK